MIVFQIEIAAITSGFIFRGAAGQAAKIKKRYARFRGGRKPAFLFEVRFSDRGQDPHRPVISRRGHGVRLRRGDFDCVFDPTQRSGTLEIRPGPQSFDSFLRTFYSWLLLPEGGMLLHCAALVRNGKACLFPGKSGAGKSTLSQLAASAGIEVISDELNLLRFEKGRFKVYGSPFWGEMRNEGRQGVWPLEKLFVLKKAGLHRVSESAPGVALAVLLRCLMNFSKTPEAAAASLSAAASLLAAVPVKRLEFSKRDAGFLALLTK